MFFLLKKEKIRTYFEDLLLYSVNFFFCSSFKIIDFRAIQITFYNVIQNVWAFFIYLCTSFNDIISKSNKKSKMPLVKT